MACALSTPIAEELAPRVVREDARSVFLGFTLESRHPTRPRGHADQFLLFFSKYLPSGVISIS